MCLAADYSDEWFTGVMGAFNVYYICMAGGEGYECCTVIESLCWDRLHDDPKATTQRWYCICMPKYRVKFGVLCEISSGERCLYCKAELPPHDLPDAKGMMIETRFKGCKTPEALLDALPRISPVERGSFLAALPQKGHHKADRGTMMNLLLLSWSQLYNLEKV